MATNAPAIKPDLVRKVLVADAGRGVEVDLHHPVGQLHCGRRGPRLIGKRADVSVDVVDRVPAAWSAGSVIGKSHGSLHGFALTLQCTILTPSSASLPIYPIPVNTSQTIRSACLRLASSTVDALGAAEATMLALVAHAPACVRAFRCPRSDAPHSDARRHSDARTETIVLRPDRGRLASAPATDCTDAIGRGRCLDPAPEPLCYAASTRGSRTVAVVPTPSWLSIVSVPCCASVSVRAIDRPSPKPGVDREASPR